MSVIAFDSVSHSFASGGRWVPAIEDVSLTVGEGEFVSVVGPSGCGKSTLLNIAAGLIAPTAGVARYRGRPVTDVVTSVGYVTQNDSLLPWRTARRNIAMPLEIAGVGKPERDRRCDEMIERVGLTGFGDHYPRQLSGGMRKRVVLARALVSDPETLLMDEPFGALDAQLKVEMQGELLSLWAGSRKTVVFVTHDLDEAAVLSDRVVVMSARPAGVVADVEIDIERPRDPRTTRYQPRFGELSNQLWEHLGAGGVRSRG